MLATRLYKDVIVSVKLGKMKEFFTKNIAMNCHIRTAVPRDITV